MASRFYTVFVLAAWLLSMGWLFVAKIWPTLQGGDPPDYASAVASPTEDVAPILWRISWNDRRIGTAVSQPLQRATGTAVRYVVQFERLPLDLMLSEALGVFGPMIFPGRNSPETPGQERATTTAGNGGTAKLAAGPRPLELEMLLATELRFDRQRQFAGFHTVADLADLPDFVRIRGQVDDRRKLVLSTRIGSSGGMGQRSLRNEIDLPTNAVVNDAFTPRSELKNLHIGQKWTIPVYRPFPPNSPVQIISAHAERHELILWDGHDVETVLVVYHDDAGSGLNATREPIGREWVREDGLVLQHELRWSGMAIRFERIPESLPEPVSEFLNDDIHSRLWSDD